MFDLKKKITESKTTFSNLLSGNQTIIERSFFAFFLWPFKAHLCKLKSIVHFTILKGTICIIWVLWSKPICSKRCLTMQFHNRVEVYALLARKNVCTANCTYRQSMHNLSWIWLAVWMLVPERTWSFRSYER